MGYDLHITRRRQWSSDGEDITVPEWLALVEADRELELSPSDGPYFAVWNGAGATAEQWLNWDEGNIYSKNPGTALISKMVTIARQLNATVQGDDGETYSGSAPPAAFRPSATERLRACLNRLRLGRTVRQRAPAPFAIGDRVRDIWGNEASVVAVDTAAEHGLGVIRTRYDDGREVTYLAVAHALTRLSQA